MSCPPEVGTASEREGAVEVRLGADIGLVPVDPDARILRSPRGGDGRGVIRRRIVTDDYLEVGEILCEQRFDSGVEISLAVEDGQADADAWGVGLSWPERLVQCARGAARIIAHGMPPSG